MCGQEKPADTITSKFWPNGIFNLESWNDGKGGSLKDWFKRNKAVYHTNCKLKFAHSKLTIVKKSSEK